MGGQGTTAAVAQQKSKPKKGIAAQGAGSGAELFQEQKKNKKR